MKVEAIKNYRDMQLERVVNKGEILTVDESRAKELFAVGVVKEYGVSEEEKPVKQDFDTTPPLKNEKEFKEAKKGEYTRETLEEMTYSDLQGVAKELKIKANQRGKKLIEEILSK